MTLLQTRALYGRLLRVQLRSPETFANALIALFFLAVYTGALGEPEAIERLVGADFLTFVLPISIISAAISGSAAGQALVADLESGYLRRLLTLPVSRTALVLAPMLVGATLVVVQSGLVLAVGIAAGANVEAGALGVLVVLGLALGWGMAFAGYSVATGLLAGTAAAAQSATFVFFPLTFLAPVFLPRDQLVGWLETAAALNPTTYVLEGMRSVMIVGWEADVLAAGFGVLAALCVLSLLWAARVASRATART